MDYTIDDLCGKWVEVGTPEAEVFLDACKELGLKWNSGAMPAYYRPENAYIVSKFNNRLYDCSTVHDYEPFTPKPQWSIYTNDKPLCELTDEQAAALFNAWRGGEKIESSVQCDVWLNCMFPEWKPLMVYRIKQKSDRELFIEKCVGLTHDGINKHLFEVLFNAGCRFTEGN